MVWVARFPTSTPPTSQEHHAKSLAGERRTKASKLGIRVGDGRRARGTSRLKLNQRPGHA